MIAYNKDIIDLLQPRFQEEELHGYFGGIFCPDHSRFVAFTYLGLEEIEPDNYPFSLSSGYSSVGMDIEKTKKYLNSNTYQSKPLEECIKEGVYHAFCNKFFGVLYEDEWFIEKDLIFFGEKMNEEKAKDFLTSGYSAGEWWNSGPFEADRVTKMPGSNQPIRNIELEEFPGMPWLVGNIKHERKYYVNRAFEKYMNVSVVEPFMQRMRIRFPDEFVRYVTLYSESPTLIFPEHKAFFLTVVLAKHRTQGYRLVWFFCETGTGRFYRWTYPRPRFSSGSYHYSFDVIEDIQEISNWDDYQFLNSSRTLDDPSFWSEFVLKKVDGRYCWLEEIPN